MEQLHFPVRYFKGGFAISIHTLLTPLAFSFIKTGNTLPCRSLRFQNSQQDSEAIETKH